LDSIIARIARGMPEKYLDRAALASTFIISWQKQQHGIKLRLKSFSAVLKA
jgi:hypothetical protein